MKELKKPGSGLIWKNKHLINYPNRIFSNENIRKRNNSNKNKNIILFF